MLTNDLAAQNFLELYKKVQERKDLNDAPQAYQTPNTVVKALDDTENHPNVILSREAEPRYFVGVMKNGKPVWSHNEKQARRVSAHLVHLYEEKLGTPLFPLWPYA